MNKNLHENDQLLETKLAASLPAYHPDSDYVNRLHKQLVEVPDIMVEGRKRKSYLLLLSVGVVGVIAGIILLTRYIWSFFQEE